MRKPYLEYLQSSINIEDVIKDSKVVLFINIRRFKNKKNIPVNGIILPGDLVRKICVVKPTGYNRAGFVGFKHNIPDTFWIILKEFMKV